jgi:hypothetical protein
MKETMRGTTPMSGLNESGSRTNRESEVMSLQGLHKIEGNHPN